MSKSILFVVIFLGLMALVAPIMAGELRKSPAPSIVLNPSVLNVGDLAAPGPATFSIIINNSGDSLLYISKIKYT
jgi:hypothetical protein